MSNTQQTFATKSAAAAALSSLVRECFGSTRWTRGPVSGLVETDKATNLPTGRTAHAVPCGKRFALEIK